MYCYCTCTYKIQHSNQQYHCLFLCPSGSYPSGTTCIFSWSLVNCKCSCLLHTETCVQLLHLLCTQLCPPTSDRSLPCLLDPTSLAVSSFIAIPKTGVSCGLFKPFISHHTVYDSVVYVTSPALLSLPAIAHILHQSVCTIMLPTGLSDNMHGKNVCPATDGVACAEAPQKQKGKEERRKERRNEKKETKKDQYPAARHGQEQPYA